MDNKILIIAGLDPSGNAGLLRDLEIVGARRAVPLQVSAVVTALTAQNRKKFIAPQVVSPAVFRKQLESVLPFSSYRAIKIGMLGNEKIISVLASFLQRGGKLPPIVLDPVCESTTGGTLLTLKGRKALIDQLLPWAALWTPNLAEASYFSGIRIQSRERMEEAAFNLWRRFQVPVLVKGGHLKEARQVYDCLVEGGRKTEFVFPRRRAKLRGTGCALATLIACFLARGLPLEKTVLKARMELDGWLLKT